LSKTNLRIVLSLSYCGILLFVFFRQVYPFKTCFICANKWEAFGPCKRFATRISLTQIRFLYSLQA